MDKPKLRHVEALPLRQRGRVFIQLHDPARISDKVLVVPQEMLFLLSLFDGTNTVQDIQAALLRQFGELVFAEKIQEIIQQLDDALMLDSRRFRARVGEIAEEFRRCPVRPPCSAGSGYPANPLELGATLDALLALAEEPSGAGHGESRVTRHASSATCHSSLATPHSPLVGLIAPHIDFERGGPSYAHAYKALAEECPADLFVVFGTAHQAQNALFTLTRKSFETPLGTLPTNAELVEALASRYRRKPFAEELLHKNEHSIEFQVLCLQHVLRGRQVELLPILCGSMERKVGSRKSPRHVAEIRDFLDALRDVLAESGRQVCTIAGADLSHVGRQFGDEYELTPQVMADVERADREMLAHVERLDADAFYDCVRADGNARHVCGVPPIYALLAATPASRCTLLDYRQATDYDLQRSVTFASLALYK
ncbi:MAG TPA: AmmeMemoRadiSam system protein B [Planctomycetota bacterium]|nr:AmmeMemoRadiSam system protein B [Planctomycetota bacterium]